METEAVGHGSEPLISINNLRCGQKYLVEGVVYAVILDGFGLLFGQVNATGGRRLLHVGTLVRVVFQLGEDKPLTVPSIISGPITGGVIVTLDGQSNSRSFLIVDPPNDSVAEDMGIPIFSEVNGNI